MLPLSQQFAAVFARVLFSAETLAVLALLMALFALAGRASLRVLREAPPDLPHRAQLLWGARWAWLLLGGIFALALLLMYACAFMPYPVTALMALVGLLPAGLILASPHLDWPMAGCLLGLLRTAARRQDRPADLPVLVLAVEQGQQRARRARLVIAALVAALALFAAVNYAYPLDRNLLRCYERSVTAPLPPS